MKADILEELSARRRADAALRELREPFAAVLARAHETPPPPDFAAAFAEPGAHVIAELKKASPSEGIIRDTFDSAALARELEGAGAAALSVLCEPHRFLGSEAYLRAARTEVTIPVLYKDFVTAPYQVAAARAAGASAVLLIAAVLDDARLRELLAFCHALGFAALVETHDADEIRRAVRAGARVIGVNCRDLRTFRTDPSITARLLGEIPPERVRIAESGIKTADDIRRLSDAGAQGFLIGTTLMRAAKPGERLRELKGTSDSEGGDLRDARGLSDASDLRGESDERGKSSKGAKGTMRG